MFLKRRQLLFGAAALSCVLAGTLATFSCGNHESACTGSTCTDAPTGVIVVNDASQAGSDAEGLTDGGSTAPPPSISHFVDGWLPATWAPGCDLYIPGSPAALAAVVPPVWVPCESGRAGCEQTSRTSPSFQWTQVGYVKGGKSPSGAVRMSFWRNYSDGYDEDIFWDEDVGVAAAFRVNNSTSCLDLNGDVSGGVPSMNMLALGPTTPTGDINAQYWFQIVAQPPDMLTRTSPDYEFPGDAMTANNQFFNYINSSATLVTYYQAEGNQLFTRDRLDGSAGRVVGDGGFYPVATEPLIDDYVFSSDQRSIYAWKRGAGLTTLVTSATASEHDIGTDGMVMAWLESKDSDIGPDGFYTHATLYTSPYATDPSGIVATPLTTISCPITNCFLKVGDGYVFVFLQAQGLPAAEIIRLSDKKTWYFSPIKLKNGVTEQFPGGFFVAEDKLWIEWAEGLSVGIQRIAIDALPPGPVIATQGMVNAR